MVKVQDCRNIVSEFELQARYYVLLSDKPFRERCESLHYPSYTLNAVRRTSLSTTVFFYYLELEMFVLVIPLRSVIFKEHPIHYHCSQAHFEPEW